MWSVPLDGVRGGNVGSVTPSVSPKAGPSAPPTRSKVGDSDSTQASGLAYRKHPVSVPAAVTGSQVALS